MTEDGAVRGVRTVVALGVVIVCESNFVYNKCTFSIPHCVCQARTDSLSYLKVFFLSAVKLEFAILFAQRFLGSSMSTLTTYYMWYTLVRI